MGYKVAVVGATGNVGRELLSIMEERNFPADQVVALASSRSVGMEVSYGEDAILSVQNLDGYDFTGTDIVLSSPGAKISAKYAPIAAEAGAAGVADVDTGPPGGHRQRIDLGMPERRRRDLAEFEMGRVAVGGLLRRQPPAAGGLLPRGDDAADRRVGFAADTFVRIEEQLGESAAFRGKVALAGA